VPLDPIARPGRNGLGLPLVRALIEDQLGGSFALTPRDGHGSLAQVRVPVR